jgi:integrase/recombinase XerD
MRMSTCYESASSRKMWRLCRSRHNRHRFAAQTLITWYRAGVDVERELPKLSTYLGHVHTTDTYWYLQAVPELLHLAAERLTQRPAEVTP